MTVESHIERDWITESGLRAKVVLHTPLPFDLPIDLQTAFNRLVGLIPTLNKRGPWRCGYVEVPRDHPLFGVDRSTECDVLAKYIEVVGNERIEDARVGKRGPLETLETLLEGRICPNVKTVFNVHGSVTFAGPSPDGEDWWFGFDCMHAFDVETVSLEYVVGECESLAGQLARVG